MEGTEQRLHGQGENAWGASRSNRYGYAEGRVSWMFTEVRYFPHR